MKLNLKKALPKVAGAAVGAVGAKMIDEKAMQNLPIPPKLKPLLFVAGGLLLSNMKSELVQGVSLGVAAYGGLQLANAFMNPAASDPAAVPGLGAGDEMYMNGVLGAMNTLSGYGDPVVSEDPNDPQLLGSGYGDPIETRMGRAEAVLSSDINYEVSGDGYDD